MYLVYCDLPKERSTASGFETLKAARDFIKTSIKQCYDNGYVNGGIYTVYREESVPVLCPHCDGRLKDEYKRIFVDKIQG